MRRALALVEGLPPESALGAILREQSAPLEGDSGSSTDLSTASASVEASQYKPPPAGVTRNVIRPSTADPSAMAGYLN